MSDAPDALLAQCRQALSAAGVLPDAPTVALFVPGRVELLGKHTDYAGGRSLLAAVDRGFRVVAARRSDAVVRMIPADQPDRAESFALGEPADKAPGHWLHYPATTGARLKANFDQAVLLRGADIAFASDLPAAAGMSSSSAFMIATFLCLARLNNLERTELYQDNIASLEDLASYLACVENGQSFGSLIGQAGVGTFGGSEDHVAILCSRPGQLALYSFAPTRQEQTLDWPGSMALAVAASGVAAQKTGPARALYNRAALRARLATRVINARRGASYRHLRDLAQAAGESGLLDVLAELNHAEQTGQADRLLRPEERRELIGPEGGPWPSPAKRLNLAGRFEQFFREDQVIIPQAVDALRHNQWDALGRLCDESHRAASLGLENHLPQTDALQHLARAHGALAASAFGAGFGGAVWAIIQAEQAPDFARQWLEAYRQDFPEQASAASVFVTQPGSGARQLANLRPRQPD